MHFLQIPASVENGPGRQIACYKVDGNSSPGVIYVQGFMSHSGMKKPQLLMELCKHNDIPFVM